MALRFADVGDEVDLENDCPLVGVYKADQLSFEDAVQRCAPALGLDDVDALAAFIRCATRKARRILKSGVADVLAADEIAAINLYTQETPLYRRLNALLRQRNRTALLPAFPFLRILLTGLHKLTPAVKTVFRGVKHDLKSAYPAKREISWWGFSSCTDSVEVLNNKLFLGDEGKRTMFSITALVVNIQCYSALQEGEYLLLPGCQLVVKGILSQGELTIVQLENNREEESLLIGFSFPPQPTPPPTPQPQPFICTWTVSASDLELTLPLVDDGNYRFEVEWGDKTSSHVTSHRQGSHTYPRAGTYTVTIVGVIDGFCFECKGDCLKIRNISQWGCLRLGTSRGSWFHGCKHMTCTATDTLDTSAVTAMSWMFCDAAAFNGDISRWDTSAVTNMGCMFWKAHAFNGDISRWDTSTVTDMGLMFHDAHAFNGNMSRWNTSAVTDMHYMFCGARVFNGDISGWDTSAVTTMCDMFRGTRAFNGDLNRWGTSAVTDMRGMFWDARAFNGDISGWDTSAVTNMSSMFCNARAFNGDLSRWDMSAVTTVCSMLLGARAFRGDISSWNTSGVCDVAQLRDKKPFARRLRRFFKTAL